MKYIKKASNDIKATITIHVTLSYPDYLKQVWGLLMDLKTQLGAVIAQDSRAIFSSA